MCTFRIDDCTIIHHHHARCCYSYPLSNKRQFLLKPETIIIKWQFLKCWYSSSIKSDIKNVPVIWFLLWLQILIGGKISKVISTGLFRDIRIISYLNVDHFLEQYIYAFYPWTYYYIQFMKILLQIWYKQLMYKRKETCTRFQASLYMSSYDNIYKFLIPIFDQNKKEETSIISLQNICCWEFLL